MFLTYLTYPFQKAQNECFQKAIIELLKEEVAITKAMKVSVCFHAWSVHGMIRNISEPECPLRTLRHLNSDCMKLHINHFEP